MLPYMHRYQHALCAENGLSYVAFTIKADQRVTLIGQTGSGKTFAARYLLRGKRRLVVIDPKDELDNDEWNLVDASSNAWRKLALGQDVRIRVATDVENVIDYEWEAVYKRCYLASSPKHPVTTYTDEVYGVLGRKSAANPGPWLTAVYTRGRSRYLSAWAATQRPRRIPLYMISEADWLALFYLRAPIDRIYMADLLGDDRIREEIPDKYGFYLQYARWRYPVYYSSIGSEANNGTIDESRQSTAQRV